MRKHVLLPGMFGGMDDAEGIDEPQMAYGVVTERPTFRRVVFSGAVAIEGDVAAQTRTILAEKADALDDLGGSYDDVTEMRLYVREEHLDGATQRRVHEVRGEFFESPHYPAATMVGVADLVHDDALIEIEVVAEIPDDEWETTTLEVEDLEDPPV